MNSIAYHTILIVIGFSGIFLGTLPDLFPQFISLIPNLEQYDIALESLAIKGDSDKSYRMLKVGEKGYNQIYNLIRSLDPVTIPPLAETIIKSKENKVFGTIASIKGGIKFRPKTSTHESQKSLDPFLFICFRAEGETYEPICRMNDLQNLVREAKIRFWSRLGFSFAFVALILGEGAALKNSIRAKTKSNNKYSDYVI